MSRSVSPRNPQRHATSATFFFHSTKPDQNFNLYLNLLALQRTNILQNRRSHCVKSGPLTSCTGSLLPHNLSQSHSQRPKGANFRPSQSEVSPYGNFRQGILSTERAVLSPAILYNRRPPFRHAITPSLPLPPSLLLRFR